jgi:hypothetical protein
MGLILRSSSLANSGNTVSVKGSALSYIEGDGNFVYLLTNMSGSNISITGSTSITGSLTVLGGITGSFTGSLTGSLFGTSSFATVAQTASSADNFNIRNTLTATTIVVQTITSSISYLTGSTRFGSLLDNTHTFTGSILLTGSLIATGSIGITGSLAIEGLFTVFTGSSTEFQVINTGVKIGNSIIDIHTVTGSIRISGSSHTTIGNLALTGSQALSGSLVIDSGSIRVASGSIFTPKVLGNTATPVMAAGTGAGSSPTINISGSDIAGNIRVLTGTSPAVKNDVVTITFASAYSSLPYVLVTPASYSSSLALGGVSGTFVTASTTGFTLFSGDGSLRGATAYTWSYHVVG